MSLMSKLFLTILSLGSLVSASDKDIVNFLKKGIGSNPNIISLDIKIVNKIPMNTPKGWEAYIIQLDGRAKAGAGKTREISQRSIYFVGGGAITTDLYDVKTGEKLSNTVSPKFNTKYYDKQHRIYGNKDAAHKVVIFSDPLCPFCRTYVPEALKYMKKYPKTFALYYYHFPLKSLHPAAVTLVQAAYVAEAQGKKGIIEGMYRVKVDGHETNQQKILDVFNKVQNTKITVKDINGVFAQKHLKHDMSVAQEHLVNGTPTVFFDGVKDNSKMKYKNVKLIK
ncbi:thioredoxin domain-containing protein [Sulfurimonas sp. MAG313]|nr:thioredoxin domain-containing protein [Sulfurimonas sp. MAG313]MDF1880264.1 thioredoxin domain-containing protein [Sulfurimonas sp. MAG313]